MNNERQVERLLEEWKHYSKIIIGVDFDDTIFPYRFNDQNYCDKVMSLLKEAYLTGAYIIIHTACNPDRFSEIENYCKLNNLPIEGINITPANIPYGKLGSKIYANIFLDDRAGLIESIDTLTTVLYKYRGYLKANEKLDDVA